MKLKIENWVSNNNFSENINLLFNDAIICYKAGAYRASLLFSYLGFLTILKERLINSAKPSLFPQGEWDNMIQKLQNEDSWEVAVFDATQQKEKLDSSKARIKDPVFSLNDNYRIQIKYWKDRRNDCAHYKDNIIESFHTESFWAFMESNLPKITVEGGMQSLINKIKRHFDPTYTPPNKDVTFLVKEIEHSVETSKIKEFWNTFLRPDALFFSIPEKKLKFIKISFTLNNDSVNTPLIDLLKEDVDVLKHFLKEMPEKILLFNYSEEEIRKFWKTNLPNYYDKIISVYSTLLNNKLIPTNEIDEANKLMLSHLKMYNVNPVEHKILNDNNFYECFKESILRSDSFEDFGWVNDRADLIAQIIENNPADLEVLERLCEVYNQPTNSNWLLERFDKIFTTSNPLTQDYKNLVSANTITVPTRLTKYFI